MQRRTRKSIISCWAVLALVLGLIGAPTPDLASAQEGLDPIEVALETVDYGQVCANLTDGTIGGPDPVASEDNPISRDSFDPANSVVWGVWGFLPGSLLAVFGTSAYIDVRDGAVALLSCDSDLVFDATKDDGAAWQVPAGTAVYVESTLPDGVLVSLNDMNGQVWILQLGNGASSEVFVEVGFNGMDPFACGPTTCWDWEDAQRGAIGGGSCGGVRCWNK